MGPRFDTKNNFDFSHDFTEIFTKFVLLSGVGHAVGGIPMFNQIFLKANLSNNHPLRRNYVFFHVLSFLKDFKSHILKQNYFPGVDM